MRIIGYGRALVPEQTAIAGMKPLVSMVGD